MKVFNEEGKNEELVLIVSHKEAREIIEALEEACKHRPRKVLWKKLLSQMNSEAGVYQWNLK